MTLTEIGLSGGVRCSKEVMRESAGPLALAQLGCCGMASGKGRYALEAAGAVVWDPERAMEVTSLEKALEVRQHFGL